MESNIEKLRGNVTRLLALLEDPQPGLMTWRRFYNEVSSEIANFVIGDALPKEWRDALDAGWGIVPCSCTCGGSFAWTKPRTSGAREMFGCVCHNIPNVKPATEMPSLAEYVAEVKIQLIVIHDFKENPEKEGLGIDVPDGEYTLLIGGKIEKICIIEGKIIS